MRLRGGPLTAVISSLSKSPAVRIFKLSFRLRGTDYEAEVGRPDPIEGRTVMAILDLGRDAPYLIHCRPNGGLPQQVVVRKPVYSVTEFST